MKNQDKIAAIIQEYKHRKETHQKQVSFKRNIKVYSDIKPFRSEEFVRDEVLKDNKPIKIRDIYSGEIKCFDNYEDCVEFLKINWVTFERMLQGRTKYFHQRWELVLKDEY